MARTPETPRGVHLNIHLGADAAAEELHQWVRVRAAEQGFRSMSAFVKAILISMRAREEKRG